MISTLPISRDDKEFVHSLIGLHTEFGKDGQL